jgi:hypothetical protein
MLLSPTTGALSFQVLMAVKASAPLMRIAPSCRTASWATPAIVDIVSAEILLRSTSGVFFIYVPADSNDFPAPSNRMQ